MPPPNSRQRAGRKGGRAAAAAAAAAAGRGGAAAGQVDSAAAMEEASGSEAAGLPDSGGSGGSGGGGGGGVDTGDLPYAFSGPCADSPLGELFLDVVHLVAREGFAAEISQCRALCGLTWRRGDVGATSDTLASSLSLQCGAAAARAAPRESFTFVGPGGAELTIAGTTHLIRAAIRGNLPRVLQLIHLGAPLGLVDGALGWRFSALHWASALGHERVVVALLAGKVCGGLTGGTYAGADIEQVCGGLTALARASSWGHAGIVRMLLARGAKQARPGAVLTPAIYWATEHNRAEIVRLLLAAPGAGEALATKSGYTSCTPLRRAIDRGHAEVVALLRAAGAPEA